MSFTHNPYKVMTLIIRDPDEGVVVLCDGCGAESDPIPVNEAYIEDLLAYQHNHVRKSHEREPEDFAGWGTP